MNEIVAMSERAVGAVRQLEDLALQQPQVKIETTHTFHAGVYARTIRIPAGTLITGALIKIPTVLIAAGHCLMYGEGGAKELIGHHVFAAPAGRKQAFLAQTDTHLTMVFATDAKTVEEAEAEFTDEGHLLLTRRNLLEG
jgi:hypothetical protein